MLTPIRVVALAACPALLCVVTAGCVNISAGDARYIDTIEKRFTVSGEPTLRVGTFDGQVEVASWDKPEVLVTIERHARDKSAADRMLVTADQQGDQIHVDIRESKDDGGGIHRLFGSSSARVTVTVPRRARVEASTGDGRVDVRDIQGTVDVRTGDGAIRVERLTGDVSASSGDGSIDLDGTLGKLTARSGDGRVRIHASGMAAVPDWTLSTGDGAVAIDLPDGFGAELDASTGDGHVELRDLSFTRSSSDDDPRVARGRIGDGGGRLTIHSGDGSITLQQAR